MTGALVTILVPNHHVFRHEFHGAFIKHLLGMVRQAKTKDGRLSGQSKTTRCGCDLMIRSYQALTAGRLAPHPPINYMC